MRNFSTGLVGPLLRKKCTSPSSLTGVSHIRRLLAYPGCPRLSFSTASFNDFDVVDGNCVYSKSVIEQRIIYTIGVSKECHDRLKINFVDIVPVGTRLIGGIRPSVFAYLEGDKGRSQLSMPEAIDYGEIIAVNTDVTGNPESSIMPPGYLVQIDAGEAEGEETLF